MRNAQPIDAWTAYFAILTEALSVAPAQREVRRVPAPRTLAPAQPVAVPAARRGWIDRLDHWFWRQRQVSTERALAKSQDIHELEYRMRVLDRPGSNLF